MEKDAKSIASDFTVETRTMQRPRANRPMTEDEKNVSRAATRTWRVRFELDRTHVLRR